jgi:hypothetical protein
MIRLQRSHVRRSRAAARSAGGHNQGPTSGEPVLPTQIWLYDAQCVEVIADSLGIFRIPAGVPPRRLQLVYRLTDQPLDFVNRYG